MEAILQWVTQIPTEIMHTLGYMVLFLITVCEGIPPLGMIISGQTIVIVGGFLSNIGVLFYPITFLCVSMGMWVGEIVSYYLGKKYGYHFLHKYGKYVLISNNVLDNIQGMVRKNRRWGMILSEFSGRTRGLFPFVTGISKIPFGGFVWWSFLGAIAWGAVFTLIGYLLGESYELVAGSIGNLFTWGIFLGLAVAVLFWYFRNEDIPLKKRFSLVAIGDIIAVVFFSFLAQKIHTDTLSFAWLDTWFQQLLVSSPLIDSIMLWVDKIFNMWFIGVIGIGILLYLYRKKLFYYFTVFASSVLCSLFAFPLLKLLIQRARPPEMFLSLHDFSFPSGHATMSIVFCLLCWYVFQRQIKQNWKRYSFLFLMICCTLLIGASRLFLYVHWFTDVLAGFLLGFAILATNILVWSVVFKKHVEQLKVVKKRCKKLLMDALL